MNKHQFEEFAAIYSSVIAKMDAMQSEHLYYLKPEWAVLNGQKDILLEVMQIVY